MRACKDCIHCNECTQDIFVTYFIIFGYDTFITKEEALTFAETFHNNRRITDKQYEDLLILIENTYKD